MPFNILSSIVLLLMLSFSAFAPSLQGDVPETCPVPAHYQEALQENSQALLKVLAISRSINSPLQSDSGFASYFMMLVSMRHYHEDQQANLPDCAQPVNESTIRTISASQDVLALRMAWQENPENGRYQDRLRQTYSYLLQTWDDLGEARRSVIIIAIGE